MRLGRLARLREMSAREVIGRSRQAAARAVDRAGLLSARAPSEARRVDRFWADAPRRLAPGPAHADTARLVERYAPDAGRAIVTAADRVCARRFDLLGYRDLTFGDPPDWHLDSVSGRRAPARHWTRIDPLDPAEVGDSKVTWELSRQQWGITLAQAYRLRGDPRYAEAFVALVSDWVRANPRGHGLNWASSLEVAFRSIAWCWALQLFGPSAPLPEAFVASVLETVWLSAAHVERHLSRYFSPNTHLTGEALGLLYAGAALGDAPGARRWRELGAEVLIGASRWQILSDGVYFEHATYYQRYTADFYLHLALLASRNGIAMPADVTGRLHALLDFMLALRSGDGAMPLTGDADGGVLVPLAPRAADDFRGTFGLAAALVPRPEYAWAAGGLTPEALWTCGPAAIDSLRAVTPRPPSATPSRVFHDGGYVVMGSGWDADHHRLVFDVGPLGCPVTSGHGHADLLSIQCSAYGAPIVVDPGTGSYTAEGWRDAFRSSSAHSTVVVDSRDQAEPAGPFRWRSRPRARLLRWRADAGLELAEAEHDAYMRLDDPVVHRRKVLAVKPGVWIVVDDLRGAAGHRIDVRYQLAPGITVTTEPGQWLRAARADGRGLRIRAVSRVALKTEIHEGAVEPVAGWFSADYGQRCPAPMLVFSTTARLPLRVVTLLVAVKDGERVPPIDR